MGLTFELTPRAEAGAVSPDCDDLTGGAGRAYSACRSESGVERVVRPHCARAEVAYTCKARLLIEGRRFVERLAEHELDAARAWRKREGGERGLAVRRKSAAPEQEAGGAPRRCALEYSEPESSLGLPEARVRGRYWPIEARASRSTCPERGTHSLPCCQRQRCVRSGRPGCRVRLQRSARIRPRAAALGVPDGWFCVA